MGRNEYELQRTDSICPSPEVQLLDAVRNNDCDKIEEIIKSNSTKLLNASYGEPYFKPILQLSCYDLCEEISAQTVQKLLDLGADLMFFNANDGNKRALHYAALGGNPQLLRVIVEHLDKKHDVNVLSTGNTALNLLVKEGGEFNDNANLPECARILMQAGIDVNRPDSKNITPILWAAKKGRRDIVQVLIKDKFHDIDLDTHKLLGKNARKFILDKGLYSGVLPPRLANNNEEKLTAVDRLFDLLRSDRTDDFRNFPHLENYVDDDDGERTLLQLTVAEGMLECVECLLDKGADPNRITKITREAPLDIAATMGYHRIFQLLLNHETTKISGNVLVELLKYIDNKVVSSERNHRKCYDLYMARNRGDINAADKNGNTPLHLAGRYAGPDITLDLLRHGASMACKNNSGILPIEDITPNTLQTHLDECVEMEAKDRVYKENFIVTFNYRTLIRPRRVQSSSKLDDPESGYNLILDELEQLNSETEVLMYMSSSPELKELLKHPVITSFLYIKWHRIRCFFYLNLALYIAFCLSLLLYIYVIYNNPTDTSSALFYVIALPLYVTYVLIICRELFQIVVSPKDYVTNVENWIEIILLLVTTLILFRNNADSQEKKKLAAMAVILAAFELVLLIGQHPKMTTNIVMLRTVSWNFFKFLIWYSILFLAFALSFYTLFQETPKGKSDEEDAESDFFQDPGTSLFKTFVMMTGEFDASGIKFAPFPSISHLVFAAFVFTMAIILFNLLNGLAVSDTQTIKSDAELYGHIARVKHINYIENMLLGSFLPVNVLQFLSNYCTCLQLRKIEHRITVPRMVAKRACIFPYFLEPFKMSVCPNQKGRVNLPENNTYTPNCLTGCTAIYLDNQTTKRTKCLIRESIEGEKQPMSGLQQMIEELLKDQKIIKEKLEELGFK